MGYSNVEQGRLQPRRMTTSQINPNQLRPSGDDGLGPIVQIGPQRRLEAIEQLVCLGGGPSDRDHARRFIEYAQDHHISLEGLWARLDRQERVLATVLAVPSPGRTAMVFASHPNGRESVRSLAGLISHACERLADWNVNLAQALLDPSEVLERETFRAGGFIDLAVLSYLERPVRLPRGVVPPQPQWPAGVATDAFDDAARGELLDVLERSYEDTMDCPGLRGYRKTHDILEGHRASGLFDASLWTLLRIDGAAAGALLLNPAADHQTIELVYLGLAKPARGRGLGTQLLRYGLGLLEGRGERTINLAVDEANLPAIALYRREGFRPALRRVALIRPLQVESMT